MIYAARHQAKFKIFKRKLFSLYEIRSLNNINSFLDIRIIRKKVERKIWLILNIFYKKIVNKFYIFLDIKPLFIFFSIIVDLLAYLGSTILG